MKNEIDKICLINNGEEIKGSISNLRPLFRGMMRWELMNSIGNKDLEKSIKLAKSIINYSDSMISLIFPLMTFFQEILYIKMNNGTFVKSNGYIPLSRGIIKLCDFSRIMKK